MKTASDELIKELEEKFGFMKVNLTTEENVTNGEGIWALPCTKEDSKIANDTSNSGTKFNVYLCNQPVTWGGVNYKDKVIAIGGGEDRAYACFSDNPGTHHDRVTEARARKAIWER
ncbi:hypothetical protein N9948_00630 [bacterium]|nr:hypothetical protein [bacterium]